MFKNTDSNGRFHSDWCSMIYSRLSLARNLLKDDGVIFISIDDNEYDNLKNAVTKFSEQLISLLVLSGKAKVAAQMIAVLSPWIMNTSCVSRKK